MEGLFVSVFFGESRGNLLFTKKKKKIQSGNINICNIVDNFYLDFQLLNSVDWDTWFHKPGMPLVIPDYDKTLTTACTELAKRWIQWDDSTASPFVKSDIENLSPGQKVTFLTNLYKSSTVLSLDKIQLMTSTYQLDLVKNSEIRYYISVSIYEYNSLQLDNITCMYLSQVYLVALVYQKSMGAESFRRFGFCH